MTASVIALCITTSGATGTPVAAGLQARESAASPRVAPVHCSAYKAVKFYAGRVSYWRSKMGAGRASGRDWRRGSHPSSCPRYLAHVLQRKARAARARYLYHWDYRSWMPAWMIRLGQCEEHLNWAHYDGRYEGAFAFATTTWDGYKLDGYPASAAVATPRQQMNVVLVIAHKLGVADPWGCWRGPQHAWVRGGLPEYGFYG